ncbi:hypothetical protein O9992_20230 [Vibrio lentus]|nr:hypothetical protein [Vibrio lentus]
MNLLLNNETHYPQELESKLDKYADISEVFGGDTSRGSDSDKQWSYFMNELESLKSTLVALQE